MEAFTHQQKYWRTYQPRPGPIEQILFFLFVNPKFHDNEVQI